MRGEPEKDVCTILRKTLEELDQESARMVGDLRNASEAYGKMEDLCKEPGDASAMAIKATCIVQQAA